MLASMPRPKLVVADTMNLWITTEKQELLKPAQADRRPRAQRRRGAAADREKNLIKAAKTGAELRPEVRRHQKGRARQPARHARAMSLRRCPPTRPKASSTRPARGTAFAGGMMGYLATQRPRHAGDVKRALAYARASRALRSGDFSLGGLQGDHREVIDERWNASSRR
jgi:hypothetical protein